MFVGLVTNPKQSPLSTACARWLQSTLGGGARVIIPEITDYEVRRELLRANKARGLSQLDALSAALEYLPLSTPAMRQAAAFWARARQQGQPTASDHTIDGDMILAGQAATLGVPDAVIATTNVGHLSRFRAGRAVAQNNGLGQLHFPLDLGLPSPLVAG